MRKVCRDFMNTGKCERQYGCNFAHLAPGEHMQRTVVNNQPCREFQRNGNCSYGNKCRFLHHGPGALGKGKRDRTELEAARAWNAAKAAKAQGSDKRPIRGLFESMPKATLQHPNAPLSKAPIVVCMPRVGPVPAREAGVAQPTTSASVVAPEVVEPGKSDAAAQPKVADAGAGLGLGHYDSSSDDEPEAGG